MEATTQTVARPHRHKDLADVVELLKRVDEARYIELAATVAPSLRPELAALRRDALEELSFEKVLGPAKNHGSMLATPVSHYWSQN